MPLVAAWAPSPVAAVLHRSWARDAKEPPAAPVSVYPEDRGEGMRSWAVKRGHPGVQTQRSLHRRGGSGHRDSDAFPAGVWHSARTTSAASLIPFWLVGTERAAW